MPPMPTVAEFMATQLFTLTPDTDIHDAVDLFLEHSISGAPVVDKDQQLVGVLSEKDCLSLLAKGTDHQRVSGVVSEFMTASPKTVPPHMNIYFAAGLFLAHPFRRFPVVENGQLVGQISRRDVLKAVQQLMKRT